MPHDLDLLVNTRWVLLVVLAATLFDVVLPFIPAETIVVAVGVAAAAHGEAVPVAVILAATAGVCAGDHLAYLVGWRSGPAVTGRLRRGARGAALHDWVLAVMSRHGGTLIVLGRYVPGVRSATAFTAGATRFPRRAFTGFTLAGAAIWAAQAVLLGYLGGVAFADRPLIGFAVAWVVAIAVSAAATLIRPRARAAGARAAGAGAAGAGAAGAGAAGTGAAGAKGAGTRAAGAKDAGARAAGTRAACTRLRLRARAARPRP
ncbi:DedA family protein [Actinoplanes sp. CA-015351]|uniref:DedA family protein n=1 Tax=Actinoplanes sp. CA-015351 TaxID=3239897 RepID=UPI003D9717FD